MCIINVLNFTLFTAFFTSFDGPVIFIDIMLNKFRNFNCFNHLSNRCIGCNQNRMTIFFCKVKCLCHHVCIFLYGSRSKYECMVISVTTTSCKLPVVSLTLCNISKTTSDSHNINNNCRQICCYQIRNSFLF